MARRKAKTTRKKTVKKTIAVIEKQPDICPYCKARNSLKTQNTMKCIPMGITVRWRRCICGRVVREETPI